ncbi:glycosyltransferase [Trueperella pyogenes]|uniref:glycosyltransferase n=1 Tax=Trueperella pyogenes TaxID=1661 RepID=UPI0032439F93
MHVLWTPSWYPSPDQPLNGSFFAEQVRMLREAAMEVGVLALDPHSFWQGRPGSVEIDEADRLLRRSVPVLPKGIFPGDQALTGYYAGPLARAYEQRYGRPDLIHAHSVFPGLLLARALAARWGVSYGLTEHRPSSLTRNRRYPRFGAIAKALKEARFRLTVSAGMARQASDFYGLDFDVLPLPVSAEFTQVEPTRGADGAFVFLHVSMLDRNKRPAETIAAFARVHKKHPATRLLIAGGKADRIGELRKVAGRAGVADSVTFLGEIARRDVPALMANADCHVLFSAQEAAGVVFSEAHAAGTPSIGSATVGGSFQICPDTGVVVPIDDVEALAAAMGAMIEAKAAGKFARPRVRAAVLSTVGAQAYVRHTRRIYQSAVGSL